MRCPAFLAAVVLLWWQGVQAAFDIDFMRHGETTWNRAKVLQGSVADTRLTAKGVAVARASAEGLAAAGVKYDRIYTSPFLRARETASIVAARTGPEPEVSELLHERGFGSAEGKRHEGGDSLRRLVDTATGVETEDEVVARVRSFLEGLKPLDGSVSRVLCVVHAHILKGLVAALRGGRFDNSVLAPNNCIHTVRYEDGRFTLVSCGRVFYDTEHFEALKSPRIVAHRGAGELTMPEHTKPAYRDAVEQRCDIVKLDLQKTKDGVIVMGHDPTLKRNMGWDSRISGLTYGEIFEKGRFRFDGKPTGERIVRLDEALKIVRPIPEFWLDFKHFDADFAERTLAAFAAEGIDESRLMVATFNRRALKYFQERHPGIRRVGHISRELAEDSAGLMEYIGQYGLFGVNMPVEHRTTSVADIRKLQKHGLWVSTWFVQNDATADIYRETADAFVTDHVAQVRKP